MFKDSGELFKPWANLNDFIFLAFYFLKEVSLETYLTYCL